MICFGSGEYGKGIEIITPMIMSCYIEETGVRESSLVGFEEPNCHVVRGSLLD